MSTRFRYPIVRPAAYQAMLGMQNYINTCGLEHSLIHLMEIRASQLNGCAFCVDMHWKDARAAGETEERLYMLSVWEEATVYTPRERAALAFTEAVNNLRPELVPDHVYNAAREHFTDPELVDLVMVIVTINGWNRLGVTFRTEPGKYHPRQHEQK